MLDARRLGPEALVTGDREFRIGDRVVCLRNQRTDDLLNGFRGVVTTIDSEGVALAAIQGLNQKLTEQAREKDAEIQELKQSVAELKTMMENLSHRQPAGDAR